MIRPMMMIDGVCDRWTRCNKSSSSDSRCDGLVVGSALKIKSKLERWWWWDCSKKRPWQGHLWLDPSGESSSQVPRSLMPLQAWQFQVFTHQHSAEIHRLVGFPAILQVPVHLSFPSLPLSWELSQATVPTGSSAPLRRRQTSSCQTICA